MIRTMCEQFIARSAEPFRLDELWPFAERLERFGIAGFGWGATWLLPGGGLESYRSVTAFRDDSAGTGARRPSRPRAPSSTSGDRRA